MDLEDLEPLVENTLIGAAGGAITGFCLSFTFLSPLVIGGIVGCVLWAVFTAIAAGCLLYAFCRGNKEEQDSLKSEVTFFSITTITAAVIGAALGTAANSLFPGVMSSMWTAALVGTVIGAIDMISTLLISEYIIEPTVEKVAKCFSGRKAPA